MIKRISKKEYILLFIITFIFVLVACGSTSPLYSVYHSFYTGLDSCEAMVVAKGWLSGLIPYKDLYTTSGPLMIIINAIGWLIGGRYGIMVIEWLCIFLTLVLLYKLLKINHSAITTSMVLLFTLFVMYGCINNGNNELEYMTLLYTIDIYLYYHISNQSGKLLYTLLGLSTGLGIILSPLFAIPLIGLSLVTIIKYRKNILYYLIGLLVPVAVISLYLYINDAFSTMLYATTMDRISSNLTNQTELLHKAVKIVPLLLLILYSIINRKEGNAFTMMLIVYAIMMICVLMLVSVDWHNYYALSLCIPLCFLDEIKNDTLINIGYVLIVLIIFFTSVKNYAQYTFTTDFSGYEALITDLNSNMEANDATFYGINTPSFFYLETDTLPSYQYFTNQTDIEDEDTYQDFYDYLVNDCEDEILVYKFSGSTEYEIGNYALQTFYYQNNEMYAVYTYSAEE